MSADRDAVMLTLGMLALTDDAFCDGTLRICVQDPETLRQFQTVLTDGRLPSRIPVEFCDDGIPVTGVVMVPQPTYRSPAPEVLALVEQMRGELVEVSR